MYDLRVRSVRVIMYLRKLDDGISIGNVCSSKAHTQTVAYISKSLVRSIQLIDYFFLKTKTRRRKNQVQDDVCPIRTCKFVFRPFRRFLVDVVYVAVERIMIATQRLLRLSAME